MRTEAREDLRLCVPRTQHCLERESLAILDVGTPHRLLAGSEFEPSLGYTTRPGNQKLGVIRVSL